MLAAAEADGIVFGGGGYRSSDSQIALRKAHCGSSDYAVYEASPSSCSPPTARPGQSMHERGLAIDFTYQGRVISSRSNPGFQWLSAHAGSYGFVNLPSEPWHWSTNGRVGRRRRGVCSYSKSSSRSMGTGSSVGASAGPAMSKLNDLLSPLPLSRVIETKYDPGVPSCRGRRLVAVVPVRPDLAVVEQRLVERRRPVRAHDEHPVLDLARCGCARPVVLGGVEHAACRRIEIRPLDELDPQADGPADREVEAHAFAPPLVEHDEHLVGTGLIVVGLDALVAVAAAGRDVSFVEEVLVQQHHAVGTRDSDRVVDGARGPRRRRRRSRRRRRRCRWPV